MAYDARHKVPAGAQAVIIVPSLVADRYIQFTPVYRGGAALEDGATLALSNTAVPVELDDANQAVNELTKALGPQGANENGSLSKLLSTSAQTLDGQGADFKQTLQDLSDVSRILSDNRGNATQTVQNLAKITQAMAASDRQIRSFSQNLATVSRTLNAEKAELRAAVKSLTVALREVSDFVKQNKAEIAANVQGLAQVTGDPGQGEGRATAVPRQGARWPPRTPPTSMTPKTGRCTPVSTSSSRRTSRCGSARSPTRSARRPSSARHCSNRSTRSASRSASSAWTHRE